MAWRARPATRNHTRVVLDKHAFVKDRRLSGAPITAGTTDAIDAQIELVDKDNCAVTSGLDAYVEVEGTGTAVNIGSFISATATTGPCR